MYEMVLVQILPHAPDGVSAHFSLTAVPIEHPHPRIGTVAGADHNQSVCTDRGVPWGKQACKIRRIFRLRMHPIQKQIVVSRAVHFGKSDLHCVPPLTFCVGEIFSKSGIPYSAGGFFCKKRAAASAPSANSARECAVCVKVNVCVGVEK